ncbi:MAG: DUF3365 domain-containing protein [Planctomycetes bacterium]|nr:DUF3365 domain-containing protein [Planctomycetota bacterium]
MKTQLRASLGAVVVCAGLLCVTVALFAAPGPGETPSQGREAEGATTSAANSQTKATVAQARERAKAMHDVYVATLDMLHHRYFHRDRAIIPARAMEDVFTEMKRQSAVEAKWIAVNLKPMSVDHEPETDFEKQAAREITSGKSEFESVAGQFYRRAGAVRLHSECISCHGGSFKTPDKTPKFAALVISIPVSEDTPPPQ